MLFIATSGTAVALTASVVGNGDPRAAARFRLNQNMPAAPPSSSPAAVSTYSFAVPSQPKGTIVALMLDTFPAFAGGSADVSVAAAQGATPLPNQNPDSAHAATNPNWLDSTTISGVMFSDALYIYFN